MLAREQVSPAEHVAEGKITKTKRLSEELNVFDVTTTHLKQISARWEF